MKQIDLKCNCGASIHLVDEVESYINPMTGKPDSKGRRCQIELIAGDWMAQHHKCIDLRNQLMVKTRERKSEQRVKSVEM